MIPKIYRVSGSHFKVDFAVTEQSAWIAGGHFGEINLLEYRLFCAVLKNTKTGEKMEISSKSNWKAVTTEDNSSYIKFRFVDPKAIDKVIFVLKGVKSEDSISWSVNVVNDNADWSVMSVTYPTPLMAAETFDFFIPLTSGRVIKDAGNRGYYRDSDEEFLVRMHHFAVYGANNGIYIGIEDGRSSLKRFIVEAKDQCADVHVDFYGINGGKAANSFRLYGVSKWQYFEGDWYDATMIYANFVHEKAEWLPEIDENGRPDTAAIFKAIPFWIKDYIPNSEYQRDNRPRSLTNSLVQKPEGYWYNAAIELQKELDVPIAYHVYNWHEIPFNIEYPHFMPAKPEFNIGAKKLRENNIYVFPYINAMSWEARDFEAGHEVTFENTGKYGAVVKDNGDFNVAIYPQTTISGHESLLTTMCPSSPAWHDLMDDVVREMENELEIDGIYFDQIAATIGRPCYNPTHNHTTGGGSYWIDGYNLMMERISARKPKNSFYFSECNTEGYMKYFDGFLTWMWAASEEVPAFPAVYAGYTQMIGRITDGKKKDDKTFFKYQTAKSLLYGQQIGWCDIDVMYDKERLPFLKKIVQLRYHYWKLFNSAKMLRPPHITTDVSPVVTGPTLKFTSDVVMEQVLGGAWQYKDGSKTVIFLINISDQDASYEVTVSPKEYRLSEYDLPEEFHLEDGKCIITGKLGATECKVWELKQEL